MSVLSVGNVTDSKSSSSHTQHCVNHNNVMGKETGCGIAEEQLLAICNLRCLHCPGITCWWNSLLQPDTKTHLCLFCKWTRTSPQSDLSPFLMDSVSSQVTGCLDAEVRWRSLVIKISRLNYYSRKHKGKFPNKLCIPPTIFNSLLAIKSHHSWNHICDI